jgi:DNA-directed RNA polymerase specialized sigma24 family protein/cytoskeletal protein RodZ
MAKNNELDKYIKKAKKDDKSAYRMIINYLWDEIYNLAGFLCDEDEQEKVTKRLFVVAYKHIKEYDENECDIHLWMAREATKELYSLLCESEEEIFPAQIDQKDYDFASIDEDDELGEASAEFNEAFLGETGFDREEACFASMTAGEKIIYLLYCYESYTVDEIETIMNIDSSFITSEIAAMREGILAAYAPIKEAAADENEDVLDGTDDADDEIDDDVDILDDERPVRKPSRPVKEQDKKEYAIGSFQFTEKQFKGLILGVFAVLLVIVIIIIVAVVSAHNGNNNTTATTKAPTTQTTPIQGTTAQNAETTEETQETSAEEETTARSVQSGTQPNVEINTTEAPTQASTEGTTAATQAATTQAETTAAATTQAVTTVAPTTTAETTTAAETVTTTQAAETTSSSAAQSGSEASTEQSSSSAVTPLVEAESTTAGTTTP